MGRPGVSVSIEPMHPGDLEAVAAVEAEAFAEPWSQELFTCEIAQQSRVYFVAKDAAGAVCGYGGIMVTGPDAHVVTLAVAVPYRERGLGSRLMMRLITAAAERGVHHLTLEVRDSNKAAQELYRKFGFERAGVRKRYYRTEDAVIMWAMNIDSSGYQERLDRIGRSA